MKILGWLMDYPASSVAIWRGLGNPPVMRDSFAADVIVAPDEFTAITLALTLCWPLDGPVPGSKACTRWSGQGRALFGMA